MSVFTDIEKTVELIEKILEKVPALLILLLLGFVALLHIKEFAADHLLKRLRKKKYRLRTTIVRQVMDEHKTQTIKLRRLRALETLEELILDPCPHIVPEDPKDTRLAKVEPFYGIPGRAVKHEANDPRETKFRLIFGPDETMKPHREYSTLLAYTLNESIEGNLQPPFYRAMQPVGKESFAYEVHFPPNRRYIRNEKSSGNDVYPKVEVYKGDPPAKKEKGRLLRYERNTSNGNLLRWFLMKIRNRFASRYHVTGGRQDFEDGHGEHDWFRVTIFRPPQKKNISICWCMDGDPKAWPWS